MSEPVYVSVMAPFQAPSTRLAQQGESCAEIVAQAYASGALDRAWDDALHLYIGDAEMPRALWAKAKPRAGALVALRPRARWTYIGAALGYIWTNVIGGWSGLAYGAAMAGVSYGISALTAADPDTLSFDPRFSIDGARNEVRPHASWNAVLGRHRTFPPHAARQFTRTDGDKVFLHVLLSLGLAPIKFDADSIQIGDTPLANFAGASWSVKEKPGDPIPAPWTNITPDEDDGPGLINASDGWVNRTISADDASAIEFELAWLEGLVRITSGGKRDGITIQLRARYRAVGDTDWREFGTGNATGDGAVAAEGNLIEITGKTELPFRKVYRRSGLAAGQYEIGVKRVEIDYTNPNIRTKFGWMKIRSFTDAPPVIDDNLALLAVTIESGPQANNTIDQVNCIVTRVAPVWDAEEEEWGAGAETSNPAALTRWIKRGPGMARPYGDDEIDDAAFGAWYELCVEKDWRCDLDVRAGAGADPEELMQAVARCGRATIGRRNGKLVPVLDTLQDAPTQLFTPRNSWGLTARRMFRPKTQAYRVQFNNAEKNYVLDEMIVYFPGYNADNITLAPELLSVTGKTRGVEVFREAMRRIAEILLRGMDYTLRTDWEHFATARGKRIAFAHWEVAVGRASGRVTAVELNGAETRVVAIQLDEEIEQTLGESYAISWRRVDAADGNPAPAMGVEALGVTTTPGLSRWIDLAAVDGIPIAAAPKVGDLVTFGDAGIQTLDLVVGSIRRGAHYEAEIGAAAYVPALYDDDDAPEPEWSSNVSGDAFPAPPTPVIYGVSVVGFALYAGFDFPAGTAQRVRAIESWWRRSDDTDGRYELIATMPAESRLAGFPPGERDGDYDLQIVAVGDGGRRAASAPFTVTAAAFGPTRVSGLSNPSHVVTTLFDGSGGNYANAGGQMRVYVGGVDVSDGTSEDNDTSYEVVSADAGLSIAIDADTGVYTISGLSVDYASASLRATVDGVTLDPVIYSIAKSKQGAQGAAGVNGAPGADGADGADGGDALAFIGQSYTPAKLGGNGDFIFYLDQSAPTTVDSGEIYISGARFNHPDGVQRTAGLTGTVQTQYGEGAAGRFFLVYSQTAKATRFPTLSAQGSAANIFAMRVKAGGGWEAIGNNATVADVTLAATDCILAVVEAASTSSGLTAISPFVAGAAGIDGDPGAPGVDGDDGAPGVPALSVSAAPDARTIGTDAAGVPNAGEFPISVQFTLFSGATDVTAAAAYSHTVANCAATDLGDGAYSITSMSADTAYLEVTANYSGAQVKKRVSLTKAQAGAAANTQSDTTLSVNNTTTYGGLNGGALTLAVGPNGTVRVSINHRYRSGEANTGQMSGKVQYRTTPGSGSWIDFGAEVAAPTSLLGEPESLTFSQTMAGPSSVTLWEFQYLNRRSAGTEIMASGTQQFHVSWTP